MAHGRSATHIAKGGMPSQRRRALQVLAGLVLAALAACSRQPQKPAGAKSPLLSYQHGTIFRDAEAPSNNAVASEVAVVLETAPTPSMVMVLMVPETSLRKNCARLLRQPTTEPLRHSMHFMR